MMDESFELPVLYNNNEMLLPAQLHQFGYTYRIEVDVKGAIIFFERDEENRWRAIMEPLIDRKKILTSELLEAIAISLDRLLE